MYRTIQTFGTIALIEGISYVLLLGIAMPLKYFLDFPFAVKIVGWIHGVLFMMYFILLMQCWIKYRWSIRRVFVYFIASLLPVVPFIVERRLMKEYFSEGNQV